MKRGTIKSFRDYLNTKYAAGTMHRHEGYRQVKRGYGDYLYHQDRAKFDVELSDAIAGVEHKDWRRP